MSNFEEQISSIYPKGDSGAPAFIVNYDKKIPYISIPIVTQLHRIKLDVNYTLSIIVTNEQGNVVGQAVTNIHTQKTDFKNEEDKIFEDDTIIVSAETIIQPIRINNSVIENLRITAVLFNDRLATDPISTYVTTKPFPEL